MSEKKPVVGQTVTVPDPDLGDVFVNAQFCGIDESTGDALVILPHEPEAKRRVDAQSMQFGEKPKSLASNAF